LSEAVAVSGNSQVGVGFGGAISSRHALLWHGTAASVIDLHPPMYYDIYASGVFGETQVGYGRVTENSRFHALLWNGTAASVIDLHPFLAGIGAFDRSEAYGISENGTIVGWAGDSDLSHYAVMWTPIIPAPITTTLFTCALIAVSLLRRPR
jgi:hypothetical protein